MTLEKYLKLHNIPILKWLTTNKLSERVKSIIMFKANTMVNNLEINNNKPNHPAFKNVNMLEFREKLGIMLSLSGEVAVAKIPHGVDGHMIVANIDSYEEVGGELRSITFSTDGFVTQDNINTPIRFKYQIADGESQIQLTKFYLDSTKKPVILTTIDIFADKIPAVIFKNDPWGQPDVQKYGVKQDLERLSDIDTMLLTEVKRSRTMPYVNTSFSGPEGENFAYEIDNGIVSQITEDQFAAKYGAGKIIIPATDGPLKLLSIVEEMEKDIYKKLGLNRDGSQDGKNRHGLEVVLQDIFAGESLQKELIRRQYFWDKLADVIGFNPINIELSNIEQAKLDFLKASIDAEKAKSQPKAQPQLKENGEENE